MDMGVRDMNDNLLKATLDDIGYSGHTRDDVAAVGSDDGLFRTDFDGFAALARDIDEYAPIAVDLVITFTDGTWLERETDESIGSGAWAFRRLPTFDPAARPITAIAVDRRTQFFTADVNGGYAR
jgi:hypothetical protein